ncbi:hypothetical protein R3P38DRAFT_3230455 [Favolaschia claudopus]|uniref:Secreted protein n=1 Tax=Favolaschia claudopus TaxID=2862362 RepID=A0AAV9ZMQ6_9AGAR
MTRTLFSHTHACFHPVLLSPSVLLSTLFPCQAIPRHIVCRLAVTHASPHRLLATSSFTGSAAFPTYAQHPARRPLDFVVRLGDVTRLRLHNIHVGPQLRRLPVLEGTYEWVGRLNLHILAPGFDAYVRAEASVPR